MNKLFVDMTFDEKVAHIKKCQDEGLEEIRKGSPSNLADIADHLDLWGPWMLNKLNHMNKQLAFMRDALLSVIECDGIMGCETVDLALEALARCKELENE